MNEYPYRTRKWLEAEHARYQTALDRAERLQVEADKAQEHVYSFPTDVRMYRPGVCAHVDTFGGGCCYATDNVYCKTHAPREADHDRA